MALHDCISAILLAGGKSLANAAEKDVLRMAERVDARANRMMAEQGLSRPDAVAQAGKMIGTEMQQAAAIEKRNAVMNLQKRIELRTRIADRADALGTKGVANIGDALHTEISALNTPTSAGGNRFSTEAVGKNRLREYVGGIESDLRNAGVLRSFTDGSLEKAWGRELYERSMKAAGEPSAVGVTGSKEAGQIADILHGYQSLMRDRLNREGAWIGDYAGYITRTAHDPDAIFKAGQDTWTRDIAGWLNNDRTFEGVDNPPKFLADVWHALATGIHMSDAVGFKDPAFTGPANIAAKMSESRLLHFKDAESWLAYQEKYGQGALHEQMLGSFARGARQEALMQRWGTNPRAEFDNTVRWLQEKYRDTSPEAVREFSKQTNVSSQLFDSLTGENTRPVNAQRANLGAGIRAVQSLAKLGGVMLTHLSSAATGAAELRYHGVGLLEAYANDFKTFLHGFEGPEAKELNDRILSGAEGMHGSMLAPMGMDDTLPGTLSKISNKFFQLTGLTYVLKGKKEGAGAIMARHFGDLIDRPFEDLPPESQRGLSLYSISPADWDALRQAPDHFQIGDRTYLTPDAAARSTADLSDRARDLLALKLRTYYGDVADRYVITPTLADQRYARLGSVAAPGTLAGEAMRFIAQFKTWPMAAVRQGIGREINGGQGVAGAITGILHLAVMGTAFGYLRMMISDISKGITPRDPTQLTTLLAALAQGGGSGILGDYLFGQTNRFGGGVSDTLLGPVLGQGINNVMTLWNDLKDGKGTGDFLHRRKDVPGDMLRMGLNETPFINIFYVRAAVNYLFLHSLQESMNPGYLQRYQQRVRQQTGQTFLISPQNHLHTFGR